MGKVLILFCLVNIPTFGDGSSQKPGAVAVKKWDKKTVDAEMRAGLPECALWYAQFSKIGLPHKRLFMRLMERISTFQATTVTATSISLFFSCFLKAVASDG
ncbi:hypothetical protein RBB75_07590 [Tunturibacter empetritectus]|uniref:Uncharacterized protein n=1 Tax=Tunturiibacter empetritectus TaxID=3069691 RepID=A0AAU7ZGQ2_9BACT